MNHANHQQQQHQEPAQNSGSAMGGEEREQAFNLIYRHEHRDYKGKLPDGTRTLMSWARYGGGLVSLATITDAELAERLPFARNAEAKRRGLTLGNR